MKNIILILLFSFSALGAVTAPPYTGQQVQAFPTLAFMVTNISPNLKIGGVYQTVDVQGWDTPGDKGGGRFTLTNSMVGTNMGTLIYSGLTNLSWLRMDDGPMSAKWWGIKGNLDSGDAAKCDNMMSTMTNGGTIKWPAGRYKINALFTNSAVIWDCEGGSIRASAPLGTHRLTSGGTQFFPSDLTKPVIKFGTSWGGANTNFYVRDCGVRNATISGSLTTTNNFGDCGVFFAGGSKKCFLENCQAGFAKYAIKDYGEENSPNYNNGLNHTTITMPSFMTDASSNDFRGLYVSAPKTGGPNGFTTGFELWGHCDIEGGPYGYAVELDGAEIYLAGNIYSDNFNSDDTTSHCVLLNYTTTTAPSGFPVLHGGYLDGGGIQVVVNYDNGVGALRNTLSYYVDGTTGNGMIKFWDGNKLHFESGTSGPGSQFSTLTYPVHFGTDLYRPPGDYTEASLGLLPSISVGSTGGFTIVGHDKFAIYTGAGTGIQNVSTTPRLDLTMSTAPFANSTIVGSITNVTIGPPSSSGSVVITGAGVNATAAGLLSSPNMLTPGNFSIGGSILGLSSNIIVLATNQLQVYSTNGILTASPTQPAIYLFQQITNSAATNPLASIYSITTNLHLHPAVSDSGSVVIGGIGLNATAAGVITAPGWFSSKVGFVLNSTNPTAGHVLRSDGVTFTDGVLTVSDIGAGILPDSQLSTNIPRLNGTNVFSGTNTFMGTSIITNANNTFGGNGAKITSINATNVTAGLFATNILGSGTALNNTFLAGDLVWRAGGGDVYQIGTNVFSGTNSFSGITLITNAANVFTGTGAGLTALNASSLASGTVGTARLGTGLANNATILYGDGTWKPLGGGGGDVFQVGTNRFTGTNSFSGLTLATNFDNVMWGTFQGVGTGLASLNASAIDRGMVAAFYLGSNLPDSTKFLSGDNIWKTFRLPLLATNGTGIVNNGSQVNLSTNLIPANSIVDSGDSLDVWYGGTYQDTGMAGTTNCVVELYLNGFLSTFSIPHVDSNLHTFMIQEKTLYTGAALAHRTASFVSDVWSSVYTPGSAVTFPIASDVSQRLRATCTASGTVTFNQGKASITH